MLDVRALVGVTDKLAQAGTHLGVARGRARGDGSVVVGADEIRAMIGFERQRQLLGCQESGSCLAEIGGALGAERLLLGSLSRFGNKYVLDLKLLQAKSGKVLEEVHASFTDEGSIPETVDQSVPKLFGRRELAPQAPSARDQPLAELDDEAGSPTPPARSHALALALFGAAAVSGGLAIFGAAHNASYQSLLTSPATTYTQYVEARAGQTNAQNWQIAAFALGGAALLGAVGGVIAW